MSDSLPPMADETLAAIEARLGAATPGPWSRFGREIGNEDGDSWYLGHDIEGPPEAERGQFERVADAELIANAPTDLRRLLDEVKRLNREFADFRQMAVLNSKAATEAVDRARSECAALAAKVGELEAQVESARRVEKGEPCPECGGTVSPWRDVRGKVGFHACTTCTWPLPGPDGKWRTAPGMPHTPAQGEWIPSMTGDECPHRPEWTCPDHAECRACECGCNTYVADLEEPDLTLIPAELVVRNPEVCSGRPTIRGTRILASTIAAELAAGTSWEQIHEWYPSMPRPAAQEAQERPGTREGDTGTGTGVPEAPGTAQAVEDLNSKHWLKWNTIARTITGCQCGFGADEDSDCGFGDSVAAHLLEVGAGAARPVHYREAAQSLRNYAHRGLHPERFRAFRDAADLLDSTARDLDDEASR